MTREKEIAQKIYAIVGPKDNIETVTHCMTRLRLHLVKDADLDELKAIPGVLGVNQNGDELQIVLGPGKVIRVADAFAALLDGNEAPTPNDSKEMPKEPAGLFGVQGEVGDGKALHEAIRQKNATPAKAFLRKVASIFMPLIPGFVGCGFFDGPFGHREILRPRSSCPGAPAHSASSGKRHLPVHEYPRRLERGQGLWRFARYWRHLGSPHFPSRPCRPHPLRHALDARPGRRLCRPPRYPPCGLRGKATEENRAACL